MGITKEKLMIYANEAKKIILADPEAKDEMKGLGKIVDDVIKDGGDYNEFTNLLIQALREPEGNKSGDEKHV